ncbi:hypothetical protein TNCV_1354561 [Trichonephila clavipes]|uniref:Uncharacterized protein n=1 Tax=Trichonephila clavipes TaxID=2585209 RepID=A0A8X6S743_TRICX|nr:hypothetical protein TNCV_1354561 [Trichonephila clavipes]
MEYDMLNALKNVKSKAKEMISTTSHGKGVSKGSNKENSPPSDVDFGYIDNDVVHDSKEAFLCRDHKEGKHSLYRYVISDFLDKEQWEEHKKEIDSMCNQGEETLKMYREYMFGHPVSSNDVNHDPVLISGIIPKEIIKELCGGKMKDHKIKFAALEENLDENYIPFPVARLAIAGKDPFCLRSLLEASKCKEYGVNAVTICKPDENKTRGVRLTLLEDENGQEVRSYEVLDGTYDISLVWNVEGKECKMKISVSDDGSVKILKRNGVTDEQICAHTEVMVGKQHETKFLGEALGLQPAKAQAQQKNFEGVVASSNKHPKLKAVKASSSKDSKEGAKVEQLLKENPEVKSALKELGSELQKGGSGVARPSTDMAKPDVKEVGEKKEEKNISFPAR